MHIEKIKIFDEYAKSLSVLWENFDDLLMTNVRMGNVDFIKKHIFAACDLVQKEQQKRIAENVVMKHHDGRSKENSAIEYYQIGADNITVDTVSIISENNLIK